MEDVYVYLFLVLDKYSSLQSLNRKELKKEIAYHQNWVNIHKREKLKKKYLKSNMKNIKLSPTPY